LGLIILTLLPAKALGDQYLRQWFARLFHRSEATTVEESTLAPMIVPSPSASIFFRDLHSRSWQKRLDALDYLSQTGDSNKRSLQALIRLSRDRNPTVAKRASGILMELCRTGHEYAVVTALVQSLKNQTRPIQIVQTDYVFKITPKAEEKRVNAILNTH